VTTRGRQHAATRLVSALRAAPIGLEALRPLVPLFWELWELRGAEPAGCEEDVPVELARVLGPSLGERTPLTVEDALRELCSQACAVLLPLHGALVETASVLEDRHEPLSAETVEALEVAGRLRLSAAAAQDPVAAMPKAFEPPLRSLDRLLRLEAATLERLRATLDELHAPVQLEAGEVLPVARWVLGGPRPVRAAGMLELARRLDDFCARAPLDDAQRVELQRLARAADEDRDDPRWPKLAERVWTLRGRLGRPRPALLPLYASLASSKRTAARPGTLAGMLAA